MMKKAYLVGAILLVGLVNTSAYGFTLISADERDAFSKAIESGEYIEFEEKSLALDKTAPSIELLRPDADDKGLKSPLEIELRFEAYGDANIDLSTLKITYGWVNITKRIVEGAEVTESGIFAKNAKIPPGNYSIKVQISDSKKRSASRKFRFTVKG